VGVDYQDARIGDERRCIALAGFDDEAGVWHGVAEALEGVDEELGIFAVVP
jgi:hypothetical protein